MGQVDDFFKKYPPDLVRVAKRARRHLRPHFIDGYEVVHDYYQALSFNYAPTLEHQDVVLSLTLTPWWVKMYFMRGKELLDPKGLLSGKGKSIRSLPLVDGISVDDPAVVALIKRAKKLALRFEGWDGVTTTVVKTICTRKW